MAELTPPFHVVPAASAFRIETDDGLALAYVYWDEPRALGTNLERLSEEEARRVAEGIAQLLPELVR